MEWQEPVATIFPQAIGLAATFDEDLIETVGEAVSTEARPSTICKERYGDTDIYKGLTLWAPNINIFRIPDGERTRDIRGRSMAYFAAWNTIHKRSSGKP